MGAPRRKVVVDSIPSQRSVAVALLLVAFALSVNPLNASGQEPGVTVINVPPEFSALDIRSRGGLHYIDLTVSDYNSWADIFRVDLEVLDNDESSIAHVVFQQYDDNVTVEGDARFAELLGEILIWDRSAYAFTTNPLSIAERSEMRVTFVISPIEGRWLKVVATDLAGLFATAQVEYLAGISGGAPLHPLVLIMLALAAAVVIVGVRLRRDRLGV